VLAAEIERKRKRGIDVVEEHKAAEARKSAAAAANRAANTFGSCVREFFVDYRTKRKARQRRWRDTASVLGLSYKPDSDPATAEPEIIKGGLVSTCMPSSARRARSMTDATLCTAFCGHRGIENGCRCAAA
jgi:hypothetical protein